MRTIDADALKLAIVEEGQRSKRYKIGEFWELNGDEIRQVIDAQPTIEPEPHWILCNEQLPDAEKKIYWVCTDSGYQCQCRWTNINHFWTNLTTDWHWHIMDVPKYSKVIAWKSLPPVYQEESNDEMICYEVQREDLATKDDKRFFNALKPSKEIDRSWGIGMKVPVCPNCEAIISPMCFWKNCEDKVGWCEYCGQKIDWSEWKQE